MLNDDYLIWDDYDARNYDLDLESEEGSERFMPAKFKRQYTVFRIGHFANKIIVPDPKMELPTGSILHLLDDVAYPSHEDVPRVDSNIFLQHESWRKYIYHCREPLLNGAINLHEKYIYRPAGLPSVLMKFRNNQGSNYRYCNKIEELPTKNEALIVINHNPIFRTQMIGPQAVARKINLVLTHVLNTAAQLASQNKQQFIMLPWGEEAYQRQEFMRSRTKLDRTTIRHEEWHYIVMMHIVNFMWNEATTSIFRKLPDDVLQQINLVLYLNDKYLIYNLKALDDLNAKNRAYVRCINQLNMLSILGRPSTDPTHVKQYFEQKEVSDDEDDTTFFDVKDEVIDEIDTSELEDAIQQLDKETPVNELPDQALRAVRSPVPVVTTVKNIINRAVVVSRDDDQVHGATPAATKAIKQTTKTAKQVTNSSQEIHNADVTVDTATKDWVDMIDRDAINTIEQADFLTPAQKRRARVIATKYKDLELDGRKLIDILTKETDLSIDDSSLSNEVLGIELPDPSGLKSSLSAYDKAYAKKTNMKHLVGAITSFQRNGVFLTNIESEKVVSELNNYTDYSCQYEDLEGKKSTIKFRIPTVDAEGRVKIDGIKKVMKKQRINLPIVKISDTEVSLSSNYNKTRVLRNTTKAHNYYSFIDSIVNNPTKSNAHVVYGTCVLNEFPLAYEYAELAERYKSIEFKTEDDFYSLFFDYPQRLSHFKDNAGSEEQLNKLEESYGTYCGSSNKNWYFINNDNEVSAVKHGGGEAVDNELHTLLDIVELSLRDASTKIKQLSEYVTIKILDANMPIIFVLAYQFGLRNILDYMGVKYTVTEGRTKLITAESGEAGNESLGVDDLKVPEKLSDQLLQVTAQQVKLHMKELYGLDTSATKVVVSRQNYYRDGTPCKKDAANEWGGCYVPKLNTVFINEALADVIRNWFKSERLTYQKFIDFLVRILAHELTHSCFGKSAYTAILNGLIKTANSAKFSTVYLDSLDKTNKNYTEELCCEYVADKVVDSLTSTESLGTEDFKEIVLRLLGNYPLDIYFTLAEKGDVLYVSRLTLIDSKTKKSKGELVVKENEYHKVAYYDNIRNDKHTAYQVLSYFHRSIMDYLKFHKGAYRKYTIEPDAIAKKLLEKYFGKLEQPKGSKNDTPDNRKRALEIILKEWGKLAQKDKIAAAASDDVSDNCGHLDDSWVKQESDIGNLLDSNGFFMEDCVNNNDMSDEDAHEQITAWVKKVVIPAINPKIKSLGYALISMDDSFVSIVPIDTVGAEALDVTANIPTVLRDIYQQVAGCKYGFWDDSINGLMDDDNESDDAYLNENARILTPQEVLKYQVGTCWDQSLAIAYLLSQEGIKFTYFFMEKPSNETHTFVVAEVDGKYYWLETAWALHKGIHAAPTENKALELVGADFFKTAGDSRRGFTETISVATVKKCWQNKNLRIAEFLKLMNFVYFNSHKQQTGTESLDESVGECRYTPKPGDIAIKFADKVLWFNRYPLKHSLIVAGLDAYDLSAYEMAEFESKDIYYQLLLDKGESINYLKGIDGFYELFIDNMTYSVLKSMHEPTNFRDLLIRAAELLTTKDYRPPSSRANHRIRGYEQFNAVLYNEMSRQFAAYRARRGRNNKFSVNPDAIYLRIVQNASMIPSESPNPLQDLKEQSYMTYAGVGGRTSDSFVVEDRKYSKDDVGVISEATVDNQKVGINAQLSLDPAIVNTEGLLGETTDPQPANIFSIYALAFPFATHDDK